MTKQQLRTELIGYMSNLDMSDVEIKKNISQKDLQNILNQFKKKNWLNDNFRNNLISILCDNLHILKNKSIEILNEFYT